jgi:hypothetical protein
MTAFDAGQPDAAVIHPVFPHSCMRGHVFFPKSSAGVFEKALMPCYISEKTPLGRQSRTWRTL